MSIPKVNQRFFTICNINQDIQALEHKYAQDLPIFSNDIVKLEKMLHLLFILIVPNKVNAQTARTTTTSVPTASSEFTTVTQYSRNTLARLDGFGADFEESMSTSSTAINTEPTTFATTFATTSGTVTTWTGTTGTGTTGTDTTVSGAGTTGTGTITTSQVGSGTTPFVTTMTSAGSNGGSTVDSTSIPIAASSADTTLTDTTLSSEAIPSTMKTTTTTTTSIGNDLNDLTDGNFPGEKPLGGDSFALPNVSPTTIANGAVIDVTETTGVVTPEGETPEPETTFTTTTDAVTYTKGSTTELITESTISYAEESTVPKTTTIASTSEALTTTATTIVPPEASPIPPPNLNETGSFIIWPAQREPTTLPTQPPPTEPTEKPEDETIAVGNPTSTGNPRAPGPGQTQASIEDSHVTETKPLFTCITNSEGSDEDTCEENEVIDDKDESDVIISEDVKAQFEAVNKKCKS